MRFLETSDDPGGFPPATGGTGSASATAGERGAAPLPREPVEV